jgi:lipid-A-disaccharide synthase-like uncharacterized protein
MTKNKLRICLKALARILLAPVAWPVLAWRKMGRRSGAALVVLHLYSFLLVWLAYAALGFPVLGVAFSYLGLVGALAITSIFMPDMVGFLEKP